MFRCSEIKYQILKSDKYFIERSTKYYRKKSIIKILPMINNISISRTLFSCLICIFTFNVHSQIKENESLNPNGYNIIYHPNGKVSSEGYMKNGKTDGYWKTYYPTGVLKSEGNRKNYLLDSIWIFYNEKGDTLQKINYLFGKRNGFTITYNTDDKQDPINLGK
ncbi:MAG: hypothetical protein QXG00_08850, partial [Candidatus Woesearchaeota archaeon]